MGIQPVRSDEPGSSSPAQDNTRVESPSNTAVNRCLDLATAHLLKLQHADGYWWGELEANCSIHAEYLLLTHFLGIGQPERWRKVANYLKERQSPDGGWPVWYGGPGDLSVTIEVYFALKLAGAGPDDSGMARAKEFILSRGGVPKSRVFTKMWLALFGQWDWLGTPVLPAELMLLPKWSPFNIYEFASWARATIVACTLVLTLKPICAVPDAARVDELYPDGRHNTDYDYGKPSRLLSLTRVFLFVDKLLKGYARFPLNPLRKAALRKAERWILEHQEEDGAWGGIQPPTVYSLIALKALGYPISHPVMKRGIESFEGFARETNDTFWTDPCISPVWDTCLAMIALHDSGTSSSHPALKRAGDWLLDKQVLDHRGDWHIKRRKTAPGGWPFEFHNKNYPDIDDTALVLIALHNLGRDDERMHLALKRGSEWTFGMQCNNGGWASFDANNNRGYMKAIPFCDFGEVLDPPTEDVTGHVIEMLARLGYNRRSRKFRRGLQYLKATQEKDGSWWGRWGVNYVYGIGAVLPALRWAGEDMQTPAIRNAVRWLETHQNTDGGWGEGCVSYQDPTLRGVGPSTASQTSWAILGLIASDEDNGDAVRRGIEYLVRTQENDGSWDEPYFTGTGFPGDFMINYHLYRLYWPVMALGQYRQRIQPRGRD